MQNYTLWRQDDVLGFLRERVNDRRDERWKKAQKYRAINYALRELPVRNIPSYYTLTFTTGESSAALPAYVDGPIVPQYKPTGSTMWRDVAAYSVENDLDGGRTLQLGFIPTSSDSVRVMWFMQAGPVPEVENPPVLSAGISASDTSLTLSSSPVVGEVGFVYCGGEWMAYTGGSSTSTTLTLTNLDRGVRGTTAATHDTSDEVQFGIALPSTDTLNYIILAAGIWLHSSLVSSSHVDMSDAQGIAVNLMREERDRVWKRISGRFPSRLVLSPTGRI